MPAEAEAPAGRLRIGLDVGGTFTDLVLVDEATGETIRHKLASTPADPHRAPVQGIVEILAKSGRTSGEVGFIGLGTTVGTNALIERKGAATGLITTEGLRDLLEIGRQTRPEVFGLSQRRPPPLIPRRLRMEVPERMASDGTVLRALDEAAVAAQARALRAQGVSAVAICFLNAYANPVHEQRAAAIVRAVWPEALVCTSQDLVPEFREFERLSATVVNAYLLPVMARYLRRFTEEVAAFGAAAAPVVMNSGGGVYSPALAIARPVDTLLSGPSGGVSAALALGAHIGCADMITFDMGGTSTDVCLIAEGRAEESATRVVNGLPIRAASLAVHAVGAGGSSIAWLDGGGLLHVGPHSAGARPGPACYPDGGNEPTVTDANVVLGRLNPQHLLDGALAIDAGRAAEAIERCIARPKGLDVTEAALAILAIACDNIVHAIRYVSVQRGIDPADFALVAFGGAGPLHAADVAHELAMSVVVPLGPGVFCASGVLVKDLQVTLRQTRIMTLDAPGMTDDVAGVFATLQARACTMLEAQSGDGNVRFAHAVEARYRGQNFELPVPVSLPADPAALRAGFDAAHRRVYGYDQPDKTVELVTFSLTAVRPIARRDAVAPQARRDGPTVPAAWRTVRFAEQSVRCPVLRRDDLVFGDCIEGPAVIEQMDATTVIPPGFSAHVDTWLNLHLGAGRG